MSDPLVADLSPPADVVPVDIPPDLIPPPPPLVLLPPPTAAPVVEPQPTAAPVVEPPPVVVAVHYARFDANGRYTMTGVVPSDSPTLAEPDVHVGVVSQTTQYHTQDGPVDMPAKPAPEYEFDFVTKTWAGDVEKLRAVRHRQIETKRDERLVDPVLNYNGTLVDADAQAKQNLQDKVTATASRIANNTPTPPQMLVWKDHDNVIHPFADLPTYKAWLDGFVIALENRGMNVWAWSWQRKDALNALQTFEDVRLFDPVAGAPASSTPY